MLILHQSQTKKIMGTPMPRYSFYFVLLFALLLSCSEETPTEPTETTLEKVTGDYIANEMLINIDQNNIINSLDLGITLNLKLNKDYTTEGEMFIPLSSGLLEKDMKQDAKMSLIGTFKISGDTVRFDHYSDTYIRDANWFYADGKLTTKDFVYTVLVKK